MSFSLFSTPQPQQPQSLFQPQQQQSSPFFQQPQQQQLIQQPHPQQQLQQQQQHFFLFTNDKAPASYGTKWADLHPDSQKVLLQIEERILEYRDESQRLDQCSRLYDSSVSNDAFELDASHVVQELGGISTSMDRQKIVLQELMSAVKDMLRNTEVAIRSFMILRQRFHHSGPGIGSSVTAPSQPPGATTTTATNSQPPTVSLVPIFDFYNGLPRKPSPFLQHTVDRFEKYLGECRQWIEEIEQLILLNSDKSFDSSSSLLQSFPKVMSNVHDFFLHVAAKVESIHQYIESMKTAYLTDLRRRGDGHDPFLEADRRATAKQEAAAKRVHPTLHLPPVSQPSNQVAGLFASSAGVSNASQTAAAVTSASTGSGLSLFGTPSSAPAATPSLFTTPSAAAPTSSIFGQSAASSQTTLFGSASGSLFGTASTPSLFASSAPAFGSTPSTGGLFSTPFASGAAVGSGASFGATSKQRPKSRGGSGRR